MKYSLNTVEYKTTDTLPKLQMHWNYSGKKHKLLLLKKGEIKKMPIRDSYKSATDISTVILDIWASSDTSLM